MRLARYNSGANFFSVINEVFDSVNTAPQFTRSTVWDTFYLLPTKTAWGLVNL